MAVFGKQISKSTFHLIPTLVLFLSNPRYNLLDVASVRMDGRRINPARYPNADPEREVLNSLNLQNIKILQKFVSFGRLDTQHQKSSLFQKAEIGTSPKFHPGLQIQQ